MYLLTEKGNSPKKSEVYNQDAVSNQERVIMAHVRYLKFKVSFESV